MTYTHLTTDELVLIESYYYQTKKVTFVAKQLKRSRQTIYNVYNALDDGLSILDYYQRYKNKKKNCGRCSTILPANEKEYIQQKVVQGCTPDVMIGRAEISISCSVRTLYRLFKRGLNENFNGLLRKDGLPKRMDFNKVDSSFIRSVASRRNNIPRKSLNYKTPLEVFLSFVKNDILSSLI